MQLRLKISNKKFVEIAQKLNCTVRCFLYLDWLLQSMNTPICVNPIY